MKSNIEIVQQFKKHLKETQRGLSSQYQNTRECQAFYAGDLMSYRDTVQFQDAWGQKKKALVQFNKVKPYVNAVKGFMAQNRRRAKYAARLDNAQLQNLYSQYSNALADYVRAEANAEQKESQQDADMLVSGYGAIETDMTYGVGESTTDPNGQIVMGKLDPTQVGWDPYAKETNLLDARWVFYQRDYALSDALDLFQDSSEDDFEESTDHDLGEDSGYTWYPRGGRYNKIRQADIDWSDEKANMVKVYFYQWYEFETFYRCENPIYTLQNPQSVMLAAMQLESLAQELGDQDDEFAFDPKAEILTFNDAIKKRLQEHFGEFIEIHDYKRKVFYKAVLSKDHVFTAFRAPCQQGFTTKFKTGDYDAKNKIWTGMINSMKDPVLYYNKALTELMFIIGANSKGGVLVEEDAVEDIQKFEQRYAKTDGVVVVRSGALEKGKIKPKKEPQTTTGYEGIISLCDASINDANGIDKTFLGSSENKQETGLLQSRRIRQVVSSLACYFDAITLYQKEHARLLLDFLHIYAENNAGGLFRIIGEDGRTQFLKISADKLVAQYDVTIMEAPQSPEEKQEFAKILTDTAEALLQVDLPSAKAIYAIALKYLPLDKADQQRIIQILTPQSPQIDPAYVQQLQSQIQALMSEATQADVKKKLSEMALNLAKIDELHAKVGETKASSVQKRAAAFHDIHKALLDEHMAHQQTKEVVVQ